MPRPTLVAAAAPLLLLLLAASAPRPARADIGNFGPEGPMAIQCGSPSECALVQQIIGGLGAAANPGVPRVIASAAPPNITAAQVAKAVGTVLAAAALDDRALASLGNPRKFNYLDGSGRFALFRFPVKGAVRGVCIFIHGCKHDSTSWFYRSPQCPTCTGLPEEVSHTKQCLARGYVVLALQSKDREYKSRCFSSSSDPNLSDHPSTKQLLEAFMKKYGLQKKLKIVFGISSGASMAVKLPRTYKVDGIVSEVNMPWEKAWGATDGKGKVTTPGYPPTVYYQMHRDLQTARQIEQAVAILRNNGIPSDKVLVPSRPVTPGFLAQRSVFISPQQSAQIQKMLKRINVIDAKGNIKYDVRVKRGWLKQLPKVLPWIKADSPYFNLISDESQIFQVLNMCWAWHEIVSDYVRPTLMWMEARGKADLSALVKKFNLRDVTACLNEREEGPPPPVVRPSPPPAPLPETKAPVDPCARNPAAPGCPKDPCVLSPKTNFGCPGYDPCIENPFAPWCPPAGRRLLRRAAA